jgi:putative FmdB family regulatory protein
VAIYPYKCRECGRTEEVFQSIASYSEEPDIPECCFKTEMVRVLTVPMMAPDLRTSYVSPIDGSVISSRAQQKEHMERHGVVHFDEIAPDIERNRKARQAAAVADIKTDLIESFHRVEAGHKPQIIPESELVPN